MRSESGRYHYKVVRETIVVVDFEDRGRGLPVRTVGGL